MHQKTTAKHETIQQEYQHEQLFGLSFAEINTWSRANLPRPSPSAKLAKGMAPHAEVEYRGFDALSGEQILEACCQFNEFSCTNR